MRGAEAHRHDQLLLTLMGPREQARPGSAGGANRISRLVLLLPVVLVGIHYGAGWARFIGDLSGHHEVPGVICGAALGTVAMGSMFTPLLARSRRGAIAAGFGVALFAWLISTQPYSRANENVPLAHLYDRIAPGYLWGLLVSMGATVALGMLALAWWLVGLRRTT